MNQDKSLVFVYNADSGIWNAALDALHKVISPGTYSCNLCAITYGAVSMKKEWSEFINGLAIPCRFLHRDEWIKVSRRNDELPAVFIKNKDEINVLIDAKTMKDLTLDDLKMKIQNIR